MKIMGLPETYEKTISAPLKRWWYQYKYFVEKTTRGATQNGMEGITYWREKLFTSFVTYLMPVCTIPLVPGVIMGIKTGYTFIAIFDVIAAASIAFVTLNKNFSLIFRKAFVVFILYALAVMLLVFLGLMGPGLIYLLAMSMFTTLTFPRRIAYWSLVVNFVICVGCSLIIYLKLFNSPLIKDYDLGAWIAVSSNLIFLSWVSVVLISNTLDSLEDTILKEFRLKKALQKGIVEGIRQNLQIKESEGHYKSLFFLSPSPMWVLDIEDLRFLQVNDSAIQCYGYTNEEFLAMTLGDIKLEADMDFFHKTLHENLRSGSSLNTVTQHRRKNRDEFYVEISCNAIQFKGKEAVLVIARDITEQINHTKAIESKNEKLHEIAYIQSHYVRAPLARIMGLVAMITKNINEKPDPEVLHYLDQSAKEFDEVIRAINDKTEHI